MTDASSNEAATEDEKDVGKNGAKHAGLDDSNLAIFEGDDTDL